MILPPKNSKFFTFFIWTLNLEKLLCFYQIRHLPTNASSFWCYFNEFSAALCFSACFCRKKQTCYSLFYCFCLFVYYFWPEVAKIIKMGFYMKGLSMWCPKIIKNHVLGIYWLMVSLDFWSGKFNPPYYTLDTIDRKWSVLVQFSGTYKIY